MGTRREFDAIVVGGGHNGLVCAGYLARAGLSVLVLERRSFVGGAVVTEELFPGYRVSSCSYICHLLQSKIIDDFELRQHGFEVYRLEPSRFQPYPDGRCLFLWDSEEQTREAIARFSTHDANAFPAWQSFWRRAAELIYPYFLTSPPTIAELAAKARGTPDEEFLDRLLTTSMKDLVTDYFDDPAIQGAFIQAQDVGDPAAPGSVWCYSHIKCDLFSRPEDVGIVKGGMGSIAQALAHSIESLGATIQTDATVDRVLVENGQAFGVRLDDGAEITSRIVISNGDPKQTLLKLVDETDLPTEFFRRAKRLKTNTAYLKFHAALSRLPDFSQSVDQDVNPRALANIKVCPSIEYFERSWHEARQGRPASDPVLEIQIPSVYDLTLTDAGRHVMSIWVLYAPVQLAEGTWESRRQEVGEKLIDCVSRYAPDVRDCIVDWSLFTPIDLERRVGLTDGNIRHLDMVPDQFLARRPLSGWSDYGTPIDGLFLCGAGTHPGGEVSGAPGHNAAHSILSRWS
ncbi:MAG: NAD(P)/FAD-dependent oxidoreductase [Planctomycetota bacterium]|nr:MAG: NAD(P)/FAD-dependent oxidoreductase [Planctomycetota bacterium]REK29638.1 MAG: NAD(P)/FAD-dependent oxidoreductase [Planctomycetota bacterium]REK30541.1 MAG: NAD(P)/FAD-dependent oxidoreductase [Planctomycetota bacterium]